MSRKYPRGSLQGHLDRFQALQDQQQAGLSHGHSHGYGHAPQSSSSHEIQAATRYGPGPSWAQYGGVSASASSQGYRTESLGADSFDNQGLPVPFSRPFSIANQVPRTTSLQNLPVSDYPQNHPAYRMNQGSHSLYGQYSSQQAEANYSYTSDPYGTGASATQPSPATLDLSRRDPSHRLRELQAPGMLCTPPLHSSSYRYSPALENEATSSSSPNINASSSPTTMASARRHAGHQAKGSRGQPGQASQAGPCTLMPRSACIDLPHAPPIASGIHLVSPAQVLPDKCRAIFPYELFNAVQSKCFESTYKSNCNVVVSAPTGSGKTVILELAICKLAVERGNQNFKIVYQAPTKALCSERARDWDKKFSHMNLKCAELTGDTSQAEMKRVGSASIIVTTPEKWDSITRKWEDHRKLLELVELFLIDEVHILKDVRGSTLEAVVSRMKTIGANVRFVALSATVPNSEDIALWLGQDHTNPQLPARRELFSEDMRPVKLTKYVHGFDCKGNNFIFDQFLDKKLPMIVAKYSQRKPILVFCFTRKSCENTARVLAENWSVAAGDDKLWPAPKNRIPVLNKELQEVVRFGVAFHHAGLDSQDRATIEQKFLNGDLHVICCTSTLAVGINLPCHTVVLKGTVGYQDGGLKEYADLEVMQMLGRAGRPQFDTSATAIIITRTAQVERYQKMVSGQQVLESTLHLNLIEHLNSEISLHTITNLESAKRWLGGTFLNVRLRKNPAHYRMTEVTSETQHIEDKLMQICQADINLLQEAELVTSGEHFRCTDYGRAMSKCMVKFETMKLLLQLPRGVRMEEMLNRVAEAYEFKDVRLKQGEKGLYREINKSPFILYPVNSQITETWQKVSLLVQMELGGMDYPAAKDFAISRRQTVLDKSLVIDWMKRLVRCIIDCKSSDLDGVGTRTGLDLFRALEAGSWESKPSQLLQIPGIGPVAMRKLTSQGVKTVAQLASTEATDIERLLSHNPPYGKRMQQTLQTFPFLTLDTTVIGREGPLPTNNNVTVKVKAVLGYSNPTGPPNWQSRPPILTFTAETTGGELSYFWRGSLRKLNQDIKGSQALELHFSVNLTDFHDSVVCHFSCESIVGTVISKTLQHSLPASAFPTKRKTDSGPPLHTAQRLQLSKNGDDDLYDLDIEDVELLEAADHAVNIHSGGNISNSRDDMDEFPLVDDLLEDITPEPDEQPKLTQRGTEKGHAAEDDLDDEPVQLPNGKWKCNHICSMGAPLKTGKTCTHKCCREGLNKPRKKLKPKNDSLSDQTHDYPLPEFSIGTQGNVKLNQVSHGVESKKRRLNDDLGSQARPRSSASTTQPLKKLKSESRPGDKGRTKYDDTDIDIIDLSHIDDDEADDVWDDASLARLISIADDSIHKVHSTTADHDSAGITKDVQTESVRAKPKATDIVAGENEDSQSEPLSEDIRTDEIDEAQLAPSHYQAGDPCKEFLVSDVFDWEDGDEWRPPQSPSSGYERNKIYSSETLRPDGPSQRDGTASLHIGFNTRARGVDGGVEAPEKIMLCNNAEVVNLDVDEPFRTTLRHESPQQQEVEGPGPAQELVSTKRQPGEPEWVEEFDPEFLGIFRGLVNFV